MNRRQFLAGLLATTAIPSLPAFAKVEEGWRVITCPPGWHAVEIKDHVLSFRVIGDPISLKIGSAGWAEFSAGTLDGLSLLPT